MACLLRLMSGLILMCILFPNFAWGRTTPPVDSLSFHTALETALAAAPESELYLLDRDIVAARVSQAGRGPNPELTLDVEDLSGVHPGFAEMTSTLSVEQRFERGGKKAARRALAGAQGPLAEAGRREFESDLAAEVRARFVAGLVAQARLELNREARREASELIEIVRLKVQAGGTSPVEIIRAEAYLQQTELLVRRSEQDLALARSQLRHRMGASAPEFLRFAGTLDTLRAPGAYADSLDSIRTAPVLTRLESELSLRDANVALETSAAATDLEFGLGVRHSGPENGLTFVGGVTLALPFRDRNQGGVLAAALERNRMASEVMAERRRLERDLRDLDARIVSAQIGIRTLRNAILPLSDQALNGLRESYRQGRTTYLDVFDARRQYVEARSQELDLLLELHVHESERLRLLGRHRDPAVHPSPGGLH